MIASNFLHAYVLVQVENPCTEHTTYKVQPRPELVTINEEITQTVKSVWNHQWSSSAGYKESLITPQWQCVLNFLLNSLEVLPAWNPSPPEIHSNKVWQLFVLCQQVSVTAREDVPPFGPPLPNPAVFRKVRDRQNGEKYRRLDLWIPSSWRSCQHFSQLYLIFQRHLPAPSCFVVSPRNFCTLQGTQTLLWIIRSQICKLSMKDDLHTHTTQYIHFNPYVKASGNTHQIQGACVQLLSVQAEGINCCQNVRAGWYFKVFWNLKCQICTLVWQITWSTFWGFSLITQAFTSSLLARLRKDK